MSDSNSIVQPTLTSRLFRVTPLELLLKESSAKEEGLKRTLGLIPLTMFSVGSILGTGIFVILGIAVPEAGPAVVASFILAGITCLFSALSYAEMAGSIPISGSSYSYTYATMGELIAWVCGWCLMLEYGVSVSAVAVGWGQYLNELTSLIGFELPAALSNPPGNGGVFNVPAVVVVVLAAILLMRGISESATINTILVFVKIGILVMFIVIAFTAFHSGNFEPFMPMGFAGMAAAASLVFFSFIGFDTASTAGEEAKNPRRDLPRAILLSLFIVTLIYVLVAVAAIGAMPWQDFEGSGGDAVLATILANITQSTWAPAILAVGAMISIFSVVLAVMYGQTRILFAMGRDGLLPKVFTKVNPKTQTPVVNTAIITVIIVILAAFVPLDSLASATSIGTLTAFMLVNLGVILLRRSQPDIPRTFKTPFFPITPLLGIVFCGYLLISLPGDTWITFSVWMTIGFIIYFSYGFRKSRLARMQADGELVNGGRGPQDENSTEGSSGS